MSLLALFSFMAKRPTSEQRLAKADKHIARRNRLRGSKTFIQRSRALSPAEKAAFHQIDGAGKSHVKRPFFELDSADENAIVDRIQGGLDKALRG